MVFCLFLEVRPSIIGKKKPVAAKKGVGIIILNCFITSLVC